MSKKEERIESKKRKAVAFLQLLQDNQTNDAASGIEKAVAEKKAKLEEDEDERTRIRAILKERRKASMDRPKVFLTCDGIVDIDGRLPPLFVIDLQHLILFGLEGNSTSFKPRWCKLVRCMKVTGVVVVVLDGVGEDDYLTYKSAFPNISSLFDISVTLTSPSQYGCTVHQELFNVNHSISTLTNTLNVPTSDAKELKRLLHPNFSSELVQLQTSIANLPEGDLFPRTHLLLNHAQMSADGYPLPLEEYSEKYKGFVFTCEKYEEVTPDSPMFAIDCEMCVTINNESELTWVSVVNEDLEVIYESLVKPFNKIENYMTRFSGITEKTLKPVTTRLAEVQTNIQKCLPPNSIICGHSLNMDLKALKMFHPYVIDTSVIYNLSGYQRVKPSLRKLSALFLGKLIQDNLGHNPCEDASATMDLVKLKLKQGLSYGDIRLGGIIYPQCKLDNSKPVKDIDNDNKVAETSKEDDTSNNLTQSEEALVSSPDKDGEGSNTEPKPLNHILKDVQQKIERRKHFFQFRGYSSHQSLFEKIKKLNKKATLVDTDSIMNEYKSSSDSLTCVTVSTDKEAQAQTQKAEQNADFVWAQLHKYQRLLDTENITQEQRKECLLKLDKRIAKIFQSVRPGSIFVVAFSGRTCDYLSNNAMGFVKVKM